jgi:hypothetical protein
MGGELEGIAAELDTVYHSSTVSSHSSSFQVTRQLHELSSHTNLDEVERMRN